MCGEKMMKAGSNCAMLGSPPRMRGKECDKPDLFFWIGITPAYAGKRGWGWYCAALSWDHPRVCGEKFGKVDTIIVVVGSPPRMRGKALKGYVHPIPGRITPAYAGKRVL